eukprot:scaffold1384_cov116-Cylindrotheca_fusiformis.AAC.42
MEHLKNRLAAISMVCITTMGLIFAIIGGTSCEFLKITSEPGTSLLQVDGDVLSLTQSFLGVSCDGPFTRDSDPLWRLSQAFFVISTIIGFLATILAWTLAIYRPPTERTWRILSLSSAFAAVFAVLVFLIFEAKPCSKFKFQQSCAFSTGAFVQAICVVFWTLAVVVTQTLDVPTWGEEAWKVGSEIQVKPTDASADQGDEEQGRQRQMQLDSSQFESTDAQEGQYSQSVWDSDPFSNDISQITAATSDRGQTNRITVISSAEGESEVVANYPAYQEEPLQERSPFRARSFSDTFDTTTPSPFNEITPQSPDTADENTSFPPPTFSSPQQRTDDPPLADDTVDFSHPKTTNKQRLSNLANKLKVDVRRPNFGRMSTGRWTSVGRFGPNRSASTGAMVTAGYAQMMGDDMSRSSAGSIFGSPQIRADQSVRSVPSEASSVRSTYVKTQADIDLENQLLADWNLLHAHINETIEKRSHVLEDKEVENMAQGTTSVAQLTADWDALHAATMSGARMGLQEGMGGVEDPYEVASYHSDPEPVVYSSDEDDDEEDDILYLQNPDVPLSIIPDDNSTVSSDSSASAKKKKKPQSHSQGRRRRSDLASLASASLLTLTIDEETVEDILEETSEEELSNTYAFSRTISAPEPRRSGMDIMLPRRGRRPMPLDEASVRTAQPTKSAYVPSNLKDPLDLGNAVDSDDQTAPRENATETHRPLQTSSSAPARRRLILPSPRAPSPMVARQFDLRTISSGDSSSSTSSSNKNMTPRERARALRIRRLQNQSLNVINEPDELSTSYMPKKYDSPAKPKAFVFKEEKKEDDQPFDQIKTNVVTPEAKSKSSSFNDRRKRAGAEGASFKLQANARLSDDGNPLIRSKRNQANNNVNSAGVHSVVTGDKQIGIMTHTIPQSPSPIQTRFLKGDDVSVGTPRRDIRDFDSEDSDMDAGHVKASAQAVRGRTLAGYSFPEDQHSRSSVSASSTDHSEAYGSSVMDKLDLQLIEGRRPKGMEYGEEEMSL